MARTGALTRLALITAPALLALAAFSARAEPGEKNAAGQSATEPASGEAIFGKNCAGCHDGGSPRAPARVVLQQMRPEHIREMLTSGVMRSQGAGLSGEQKTQVAEFLAGRRIGAEAAVAAPRMCSTTKRWHGLRRLANEYVNR